MRFSFGLGILLAGLALAPGTAMAQGGPTPESLPGETSRPGPVASSPLPPVAPDAPSSQPSSPPTPQQPSPPAAGQVSTPVAPAKAARPTLLPNPGDPVNVDEVTLPSKPAAVVAGISTWDDGLKSLTSAFKRVEEELAKAAIAPAGRPVTIFTETDDLGFRYEAMIPIEAIPEGRATLTPEIRFGRTPEGKALRFVHKGPYEEIDATYETITAYLDAKGVVVKDAFIEEYVNDVADPTDGNLEINIFVQPQ